MRLDFTNILNGIWCRGTESNCRHQPFQDVGEFCNELKLLMSFCRSEHGQLNGQPATSNVPQGRLNQQPRSRLNCHCALGKRPEHVSNGVVIGVRSLSRCGVLPPCRFSTVAKCPSRLTVSMPGCVKHRKVSSRLLWSEEGIAFADTHPAHVSGSCSWTGLGSKCMWLGRLDAVCEARSIVESR